MNIINKQKFLAELGKLLTFMYDEDRQAALAMYNKMFDEAVDEQSLLQFLVSPTRQAVVIARAYDSRKSALNVHAKAEDVAEDAEAVPAYLQALDKLEQLARDKGVLVSAPAPEEGQFSMFDAEEAPAEQIAETPAAETEAAPAEQTEESSEAPRSYELPAEDDFSLPDPAQFVSVSPDYQQEQLNTDVPAGIGEITDMGEAAAASIALNQFLEEVDAHIESQLSSGAPAPEAEAPAAEEAAEAVAETAEESVSPAEEVESEDAEEEEVSSIPATVRKARVPLLILFIILAIPVTLIGAALILIPTLLCLAAAVSLIFGGCIVFSAAFSGFAVFADIMIVLGTAVIILALGMFFLWAFVWFIGGAEVGFVRSIIRLGSRWCYKEVQAE